MFQKKTLKKPVVFISSRKIDLKYGWQDEKDPKIDTGDTKAIRFFQNIR